MEEEKWVPLQCHSVFCNSSLCTPHSKSRSRNLLAYDGTSHLYVWDFSKRCVHCLTLRFENQEPAGILAASTFKTLQPDVEMGHGLHSMEINRTGESLLIFGDGGLFVLDLFDRTSTKDHVYICRSALIGSQIYFGDTNFLRVLQVSWHPYSESHIGVLSSDTVFRLFDLSSDLERPEQEYYLQPLEPARCHSATSLCPVAFSFGGEHLWDRFTVFLVFADGSTYAICPIAPFGSVYNRASIEEIYKDAHTLGLKSANSRAVNNSSLAITWLEATFPDLNDQNAGKGTLSTLKAHPYASFDVSLSLQGPFHKICNEHNDDSANGRVPECEGRAVSFLCRSISKDTVNAISWSSGQIQIDALADEVQPVWNLGSSPRLCVDNGGIIEAVAMICDSSPEKPNNAKLYPSQRTLNTSMADSVWIGDPPPLLRLAVVDLALPSNILNDSPLTLVADPLIPERFYCLHRGGVDSIMLHFLPFSDQTIEKNRIGEAPSVHPVLTTYQSETLQPFPLSGFVAIADSFGNTWTVALTSSFECLVMEMTGLSAYFQVEREKGSPNLTVENDEVLPELVSRELLMGPKDVPIPQLPPSLRSLTPDSIEGRSTLHEYFKILHEKYVEYAHKVYVELNHHAARLKKITDDQVVRLHEVQQNLLHAEEDEPNIRDRIGRAFEFNLQLVERLQVLRSLPGIQQKPLTKAEREFKSELETFASHEIDALHSAIEALSVRLRRHVPLSPGSVTSSPRQTLPGRRKIPVPDIQISQLKSSVAKLSLINSENTKKVKLVETTLRKQETRTDLKR
ncbi:nuclear pore complex protein NUP88 isoform X1 [Amborella trichopoda]|uniref:nuclear pore complex protein NUP88 isoform X1 n=1 Tax=Amborella trichopoda TaxID=13333 RepID=UPI0005D3F263|nr:nuclear pore complex protein NUP88 isoform X1 [Amborella trichopoda]|eukprot:XP_011623988.1 nuclear pore complex protein NUP88 isoform X1 [Amborella trichopoda]